MVTNAPEIYSYPYSHPSLIREHKVVLRLFMIILMNRGVPEEQAKRQADRLLRPLPPGKQRPSSAKPRAMAG
jgi:hypothetical protein